jgi:hypothetical protein
MDLAAGAAERGRARGLWSLQWRKQSMRALEALLVGCIASPMLDCRAGTNVQTFRPVRRLPGVVVSAEYCLDRRIRSLIRGPA